MLEEFYNIFGPELKAVTGDPKRIEDVLKRVDALVKPIEEVSVKRCYLERVLGLRTFMLQEISFVSEHDTKLEWNMAMV